MSEPLQYLKDRLVAIPQASYPVHSRVHALRSFIFPHATCFVKRDDELGFGISGSKIRKYRSLIPWLVNQGIQEVVIIGSAYSNHVLSVQQLLIENGVRPTLFLRGDPHRPLQGNLLLTSLFVSPTSIHWFSKTEWQHVEEQAHAYARQQPHPTFVLPEGGFSLEALPGALTLPLDVQENEKALGLTFDHIFIEAGTGFTASALILGLHWLKRPTLVHVILLAQDSHAFLSRLQQCHEMFMQWMQCPCSFPQHFVLHTPQLTGKFGQVDSFLFEAIAHLAQKEGFLTDPIYTVKLFIESKQFLTQKGIRGNILIHHSGGALTLMGFQEQLKEAIL
jgi:1-aminocyclopropane-1-carboxylate deaminase/D-cysteine desulfhydrase-like pyridoxal-dependent ACC family enzyme